MPAPGFYAVAQGRQPGVYTSWDECKAQVDGFQGARHRKFKSRDEANTFVAGGVSTGAATASQLAAAPAALKRKSELSRSGGPSKAIRTSTGASPADKQIVNGIRIIDVFTDGASSRNGQASAQAGWGVHFPEGRNALSDLYNLDESGRLDGALQTNNRGELMAIIRAMELCPDADAKLHIHTDSQYSINALTVWLQKWRANQWRGSNGQDVMNRDLISHADQLMRARRHPPLLIHVKGHGDSAGNQEADRLAVRGAALPSVPKERWRAYKSDKADDALDTSVVSRERAKEMWVRSGFTIEQAKKKSDARVHRRA